MALLNKDGSSGKIDKVTNPNANNLAKINSYGGIENSNIQVSTVELNTNKATSFQATPDNTKYPTEKLVKDNLDLKVNTDDIIDNLSSTDANKPLSANQGKILQGAKANKITGGTDGNIITRDASGDIQDSGNSIAGVKARSNHTGSQAISTVSGLQEELDSKIPISDIKDNLTSTNSNKPLSANQGKALQDAKANKITGGTDGNLVKQDANGDIIDVGVSGASFNGANQLVKLDSNGKLAVIDGSQLTNLNTSGLPTGSIIPWEGSLTSLPTGWLYADGSIISRTTYSNLFSHIGTKFGAGDGSSTFSIPDYRGRALRGTDNGAGVDPDASSRTINGVTQSNSTSGTVQGDEVTSHDHHLFREGSADNNSSALSSSNYALDTSSVTWNTHYRYEILATSSVANNGKTSAAGGNETRMKNIAVHYLIKY